MAASRRWWIQLQLLVRNMGERAKTRNFQLMPFRKTIHGGNIGGDGIPFYLQPGQCEPEYDQGHSVVVWYDDLYDLDQSARFSDKFTRAENGDVVCVAHGTAIDVHCCNCHNGFIFDPEHECPDAQS
jgi:hypothetical protein